MLFATREEIYGVPHPPMPPRYKMVHTQENNKVADIRDAFNRLWFRVFLNGVEQSSAAFGMNYTIEVVNYTVKDPVTGEITPLIILTIPDAGSVKPLTDFKKAMKIYDDCVQKYTSLVKASTRELQDIDVFKDKIGYKCASSLSCCATCEFLHKHRKITSHAQLSGDVNEILDLDFECWNPENTIEYNFDVDVDMRKYPFEHLHGHLYRDEEHHKAVLKPAVKMLCICDNFKARPKKP